MAHALSDLNLARLGQEQEEILHEQICFHAQQAVEKALKAVLLFKKVDFPLTHDLDELLDIAEKAGITLPPDMMDVGLLTPYAVETRYPGYWEEITEQDVDDAIKLARKTLMWASESISKR
ncbi:MAG TPA: HEPN domain-containing protein [Thermodesulfovibrionales bacterium]|nr:HEPN domain-containing protein [Thermodesulfovibrionales bacterium]